MTDLRQWGQPDGARPVRAIRVPPPWAPVSLIWRHRDLLRPLIRREIQQRHRGSMLGLAWTLIQPLAMLLLYSFFFGQIAPARWSEQMGDGIGIALILFSGLILHGLFADALTRAPGLIHEHRSFVRQIVFPLEILPLTTLGAALVQAAASLAVLVGLMVAGGSLPGWTALLLPATLLPLILISLGIAWSLAALGVYLRDLGPLTSFMSAAALFLAPVFYPASSVPAGWRGLIALNPLTYPIEATRQVLLRGEVPALAPWLIHTAVAVLVAWAGLALFNLLKPGFADVI